ncbi:MAG: hypothetical protein ACYSUQ_02355 [Planctomycetota bacterium]|jgi:hypothetical protein
MIGDTIHRAFLAGSVLGLMISGCAMTPRYAQPEVTLLGLAAKCTTGDCYAFVDLNDDIAVENQSLKERLDEAIDAYDTIETSAILKLRVKKGDDQFFKVFFGPLPGSSGSAAGRVKSSTATFELIYFGWVYLTGLRPQVETPWVQGGAIGSTIIAQIVDPDVEPDEPKRVDRIFFVEGAEAWVRNNAGVEFRWNTPETYVEVDSRGAISDPAPANNASTPAVVRDFYRMVLAIGAAGA